MFHLNFTVSIHTDMKENQARKILDVIIGLCWWMSVAIHMVDLGPDQAAFFILFLYFLFLYFLSYVSNAVRLCLKNKTKTVGCNLIEV